MQCCPGKYKKHIDTSAARALVCMLETEGAQNEVMKEEDPS
jgi:hypothetical protein